MDFTLILEDGDTREIEIPEKMPYRLGKKIRRKIRSKAILRGNDSVHEIENPVAMIADMTDLIVQDIVPEDWREHISEESADALLEFYYDQIQGKKVKKKSRGSASSLGTGPKRTTRRLKKPSR